MNQRKRGNVTVPINQSNDRRQETVNRCWEVAAVASDSILPCCGPTNINMHTDVQATKWTANAKAFFRRADQEAD